MSLEVHADPAAPLIERFIACVSNASARHLHYLTKFKDNHKSLMRKMSELRGLEDHVERRVEVDEASQEMQRIPEVAQWIKTVGSFEHEVDLILQKCSAKIEQRCCGNYCPKNWCARYKLGKKVCKNLITVADLISKGKFDVVADKSRPTQVQVQPDDRTVGMDAKFEEVWSWLGDDHAKIIGIYGMGGVGKTTLLKKINNKFEGEVSSFDLVIWVVVSSKFSVQNVQKQIGKRLGLAWSGDDEQNDKARRLFNVLIKKRFLLLLDDVWEHLDLQTIGIPSPHISGNNSKVVFTTRSEIVCGSMEVSKRYKVPVLEWEQAWELFRQKVGEYALNSHPERVNLAKAVAGECGGLPLALITTGKAMASKKTPHEWNYALTTLKQNAAVFSGMENKVLSILKFSYDILEDDTARDCFLYCSLYPEDYDIEIKNIVDKWVGEGFLDKFRDLDAAIDKGHDIIGSLKASCLLEPGHLEESYVKMHDIVRDLALWIAQECGQSKNKYIVQAGFGLSEASKIDNWKDAEKISLMKNDLKELTGAPECPRLVTLILQMNKRLSVISDDFFQYMPKLKVLDLGETQIKILPKSIGCLLELRYLNLSETKIETLPNELRHLVKLMYLNLHTDSLENIPPGIMSCFPRLQVFYSWQVCWDGQIEADLEALQHLRTLYLSIKKLPASQGMLLQKSQSCLQRLLFDGCSELTELAFMSSFHLGRTKILRQLEISVCNNLQKWRINSLEADDADMGPLSTLEKLKFFYLPKLSNIIWAETATHLHFKHLAEVRIGECGALKDISWLVLVPFLRVLLVSYCWELEEIILDKFAAIAIEDQNALSRLVNMQFTNLPKLKSIVRAPFSFPCLRSIEVKKCPLLKKLPFASNSVNDSKLQEIQGEARWWNGLEWEDDTIKTSLQPIFIKW